MLLHGTEDKLVPVDKTVHFINTWPARYKTLILFSPLFHEPHNEPEQREVAQYYLNWVLSRSNVRAAL